MVTPVNIERAVADYVARFHNTPKIDAPRAFFGGRNPELVRLITSRKTSRPVRLVLGEYLRSQGDAGMRRLLVIAAGANNSFDTGLCMGFMGYTAPCNVGGSVFRKGFQDGLIYHCKTVPPALNNLYKGSLYVALLSLSYLYFDVQRRRRTYYCSEAERTRDTVALHIAPFSLLYGFATMWKTSLFRRDEFISRKLVTSGPFFLHRNPFYASGFLAGALGIGVFIGDNLHSKEPAPFACFALTAAGLVYALAHHRYVLRDEKVLELTFGEAYRAYKVSTPRYLPAVWKFLPKLLPRH